MTRFNSALARQENTHSTLKAPDLKFGAASLACASSTEQNEFLTGLSDHALAALPYVFEFWALEHQLPPEGDWRSWVVMGGRGAGKTRAGAEWLRAQVEGATPLDPGVASRAALVGETFDQVRDVMIFGASGIMACTPPDRRPKWEATRRRLVWPNGAVAECHSASSPEEMRGPQFDVAWLDELAKWGKGDEAWDMLQFGLRLGAHPRQVVTTTPKNVDVLKGILEQSSTVVTSAPTEANAAYLAENFLKEIRARYGGTRQGRQELDGELVEDLDGALWTMDILDGARRKTLPEFDRVVVAVDPVVSRGGGADACGIVVAGAVLKGERQDWHAVVLEDATVHGASPLGWATAAVAAAERHGADRIVAEVNQGGALVEEVLRQVDPLAPYKSVHASSSKAVRAEPIAALYEQGRVSHYGDLTALEDQMSQMTVTGFKGRGSPDRVDALVWAIRELLLGGEQSAHPRIRTVGH